MYGLEVLDAVLDAALVDWEDPLAVDVGVGDVAEPLVRILDSGLLPFLLLY